MFTESEEISGGGAALSGWEDSIKIGRRNSCSKIGRNQIALIKFILIDRHWGIDACLSVDFSSLSDFYSLERRTLLEKRRTRHSIEWYPYFKRKRSITVQLDFSWDKNIPLHGLELKSLCSSHLPPFFVLIYLFHMNQAWIQLRAQKQSIVIASDFLFYALI